MSEWTKSAEGSFILYIIEEDFVAARNMLRGMTDAELYEFSEALRIARPMVGDEQHQRKKRSKKGV